MEEKENAGMMPEASEGQVPAGASPQSKKDSMIARLRERYPDKEFADDDDEAAWNQVSDDYDDYEQRLGEYQGREKTLSDLMNRDPASASFLLKWRDGANPVLELVRQYGSDFMDYLEDPDHQEEIAAANKEYVDRLAENRKLEDEYQENIAVTFDGLRRMQDEEGLSDDDIDNAMELLQQIVSDGIVGRFTPESIHLALKARDYDNDVAVAGQTGEVRGRNAKISEQLRKGSRGDGTPALDGANNTGAVRPGRSYGALDRFAANDDIWQRGGEKRTRIE